MTMIDLENEVREALTDLANQSRPVNLASSAIHRARVTRRRQVALSGIAVIALIAAIVVPLSRLRPTTDRAPIAGKPAITTVPARSVTKGAVELPGGWILGSGSGPGSLSVGMWYWDRVRKAYRWSDKAGSVAPAPRGDLVYQELLISGQRDQQLLDLKTSKTRDIALPSDGGPPVWDPTGTKLLTWLDDVALGRIQVFVYDTATHQTNAVPIAMGCSAECDATWLPDGTISVVSPGQTGVPARADVVDSGTGQVLRQLNFVPRSAYAFSPSRTEAIAQVLVNGVTKVCIVDAATGRVLHQLPGEATDPRTVYWVGDNEILAVVHGAVLVVNSNGDQVGQVKWPTEFTDTELPNYQLIRS
jgi:hypothetical protein